MMQPLLRKLRAWQMEVIKSENIMLTVKFIRLLYYVVGAMFPSALENVSYQNVLPYLFMLVELGGLLESSVETNVPRMQQLDILNHQQQPTSVTSGNELNGTRSPCSKEDQELSYVMPTQQGSLTPRVEAGPGAMAPSVAVWVLESGAGFHMTGNLQQLLLDRGNLVTYYLQLADALRISDGDRSLHILGCGSVKTDRIEVPNVRYVQGLTVNVISVLQLAREHSLEVTFEPRYCYIRKSGGQIVGRGARSRNGIYVLEYLRIRLEDDASLKMDTGTRDADDDDGSQPQAGPDPHSCVGSDMAVYRVGVNKSLCSSWDDSSAVLPSIHRALSALAQHAGGAGSEMLGFSSGDTMPASFTDHDEDPMEYTMSSPTAASASFSGHDEDPMEYTMSSPTAASGHCPRPAPATFIFDSGASNHMTGKTELFTLEHYQRISETKVVFIADGRALRVVGVGSVTSAGINLPRVQHVEGMKCDILVSVSQLTRDHDVKVVFERECVTIKELRSEETVGEGHFKDGVYHLDSLSL